MVKVNIFISGRVQGVGFRFFAKQKAQDLKLVGWVRNRLDGQVELEAVGQPGAIDKLISWLYRGSPLSCVDDVEVKEQAVITGYPLDQFEIRPTE